MTDSDTENSSISYEKAKIRWGMQEYTPFRKKMKTGESDNASGLQNVVAVSVGVIVPPSILTNGIIEIVGRIIEDKPTDQYFHAIACLDDDEYLTRLTPGFRDVAPFFCAFIRDYPVVMFDEAKEKGILDYYLAKHNFPALVDERVFSVASWIESHFLDQGVGFDEFIANFILDIETNRTVITGTRQYADLLASIFVEIEKMEQKFESEDDNK
ncbi:MAG: hypothetical protein ACTSXQ_02825 [Alphaproteobacteria bacterium]